MNQKVVESGGRRLCFLYFSSHPMILVQVELYLNERLHVGPVNHSIRIGLFGLNDILKPLEKFLSECFAIWVRGEEAPNVAPTESRKESEERRRKKRRR